MADSQPADSSKIFSLRIVSIDHYMSPPIPGVDICYSSFQGNTECTPKTTCRSVNFRGLGSLIF